MYKDAEMSDPEKEVQMSGDMDYAQAVVGVIQKEHEKLFTEFVQAKALWDLEKKKVFIIDTKLTHTCKMLADLKSENESNFKGAVKDKTVLENKIKSNREEHDQVKILLKKEIQALSIRLGSLKTNNQNTINELLQDNSKLTEKIKEFTEEIKELKKRKTSKKKSVKKKTVTSLPSKKG